MISLHDWYRSGGPFMLPVLIVALLGLGVAVERTLVIVVRSRVTGRLFMDQLIQLVRAEKIEEAIALCTRYKAVLPDLGLLILRSRSHDDADLRSVASAAASAVSPGLRRRLRYLPVLAVAAALVGGAACALGLASSPTTAGGVTDGLAGGSRSAAGLTALSFGLAVAAVLILAHAWLASQADILHEQIEELSSRLINALTQRADVRLGHR